MDANVSVIGDQSFEFSNTIVLVSSVAYFYDGANTIVQADTDGNVVTAEFQIQLTGDVTLLPTDFIL